jgi:glycerol-3-phosphate dehydrogenase
MADHSDTVVDLFVIGGGINGTGIARDAVGRGLSVVLAEKGDLASATSSASTKLFHGGLRYLEYFEFGLVAKALEERETLLKAMPHISWPMRFVLPYHEDMRFESSTPTSRLLGWVLPWMKGCRPRWLLRLGLFLYDHLGGREILPGTRKLDLKKAREGAPLQDRFEVAYEYSDCWVEDSRLVVLNARDAVQRGAEVLTRAEVICAERVGDLWQIKVRDGGERIYHASALVNATGPWVSETIRGALNVTSREGVRLVRGSHIVTKRLYDHDKAYFLQGRDGRIIFLIPYETDFTLVGTTDAEHGSMETIPHCTDAEADYLCAFASEYLKTPVTRADIVWRYAGVRPLYNDGATCASAATRDYVLSLDASAGKAPLLNVFGGKITTYRKLAEEALCRLSQTFPQAGGDWTAGVALPGGHFPVDGVSTLISKLKLRYPFLSEPWATRLVKAYGTDALEMLADAKTAEDLGQTFGATLTAREIDWLMKHEFARTAEDVVWRRSRLGLRMSVEEIAALDSWMAATQAEPSMSRKAQVS